MQSNYNLAIKKALFYKGYSFFFFTTIIFGLFVIYFIALTSVSIIQQLPLASKDFWTDNLADFEDDRFIDPLKKNMYLNNLPLNTTYFETESWQVNTSAYIANPYPTWT